MEIPQQIAGLLMSAIISDTVLFKSPTCTQADKDAVEYLAKIAGVDYKEYGLAMLKAGADIGDMTPADIVKKRLQRIPNRQLSDAHQPAFRNGYGPGNGYAG